MNSDPSDNKSCALCDRKTMLLAHHLIPRKLHRRKHFQKHYSKEDLNRVVELCRPCHAGLHKLYSEMELAKSFNTVEKMNADPAIRKHVDWVARQRVNSQDG